jgi:protein SCO1/2
MRRHFFGPRARSFARTLTLSAALVAAALSAAGCGSSAKGDANAQRYDLKGKVVSVDRAARKAAIDHEAVPGFMDAMVMDFNLKDADALSVMEPGDRIQATLVVADEGAWLENPMITKGAPDPALAAAAEPGARPGDEPPDVSLVSQDDRPLRLKDYRGRAVLVTFIYTRCPLADYCPLVSQRFASLLGDIQRDAALRDHARLLSVSIDPQHDTPKVLRSYGGAYTENYGDERFETWQFATGNPDEIRKLAAFFGMDYYADKDQIAHTLRTAVIDARGRVWKVYRGSDWQLSEVLTELRKAAEAGR